MSSSASLAIQFENVSKKFTLHLGRPRSWQELFLSWRQHLRNKSEELWVLKDVSFHIVSGETVGIIGPNGAGKSTILKLIAGIIVPTAGQVKVSGRVSSLLELGAGFHPDLTGRENIFLYGTLLGLSRAVMRQRYNEIVDFSELEAFIDVPVKNYSSGMYLRLAFSVAIHVDPEVLLVDEILAVGDQAFQSKCLERISALKRDGVTILLVSHELGTVRRLCTRAIWLEGGQVAAEGPTDVVVRRYLDMVTQKQSARLAGQNLQMSREPLGHAGGAADRKPSPRWGSGEVEITQVRVLDSKKHERYAFVTGEELTIQIRYCASKPSDNVVFGLALHRSDGLHVTGPNSHFGNLDLSRLEGEGVVDYTIPWLSLLPGLYYISATAHNVADTRLYDHHERMYAFTVNPGGTQEQYGLMCLGGEWQHRNSR